MRVLKSYICFIIAIFVMDTAFATNKIDGLISAQSKYSVNKTVKNFESEVQAKGLKVFVTIDHSAGAKSIGQDLRETKTYYIW